MRIEQQATVGAFLMLQEQKICQTGNQPIRFTETVTEPQMTEPRKTEPRKTEHRKTEPRMTELRMTEPRK
jgi:hypothetical protein